LKNLQIDIQSVFGSYPRNLEVERPHEQQQSSAGREAKIHQSFFRGRVGCQTSTEFSTKGWLFWLLHQNWSDLVAKIERSRYGFVSKFGVLQKGPFVREHDDFWGTQVSERSRYAESPANGEKCSNSLTGC